MYCSVPDNIGDKKYCTPWKQKVLKQKAERIVLLLAFIA